MMTREQLEAYRVQLIQDLERLGKIRDEQERLEDGEELVARRDAICDYLCGPGHFSTLLRGELLAVEKILGSEVAEADLVSNKGGDRHED